MAQNCGSQSILWRYKTPLLGGDLAQVNANVLYPGIYSGLIASNATGGLIVHVTAGTCLIFDSASYGGAAVKMVKIVFGAAFDVTCTAGHRYLVVRYTWLDAITDYFAEVKSVASPAAYDVVLCALEWVGADITRVDTASATYGFKSQFDAIINNLRPLASTSAARTVSIAAGRFVYARSSVSYAGGSVQLPETVNVDGRYHAIGLNAAGAVVTVSGTEGGAQPDLGANLPIAMVHVRPGVGYLLQSDIVDIRPFLTFSGVMEAINVTIDIAGLGNMTTAGATLQTLMSWLNTKLFDGASTNAGQLQGKTFSAAALAASDAVLPTAKAVKDYVDAGLAANAAGEASTYKTISTADAAAASLLSKINALVNKDVGKIAWFAFTKTTAEGWLRCDGTVIDKAVNAEYTALVDKLRVVAGVDGSHPYYDAIVTKAKLPDLRDRYVKDIGTSGRKLGEVALGAVKAHAHGPAVTQSAAPASHTHTIAHTHAARTTGAAQPAITVVVPGHTHKFTPAPHFHKLTAKVPGHAHGNETYRTGSANGDQPSLPVATSWPASLNDQIMETHTPTALDTGAADPAIAATATAPAHTHTIPETAAASTPNSGGAAPDTHTHAITIESTGGATNEVNNVPFYAYIFWGMP